MSLKVKTMLATAVFSIGLFVNASPIWAEPQPLTIPSNGIVLQGKAKEKYAADYMKTYFRNMKPPAPFEAPAGWKMETVTLTVYPGMSHDFALLLPEMQDSINSLKEIADFANRYMK